MLIFRSVMIQEDVLIVFHPLTVAYLIGPADNLPYTPVSTLYIAEYHPQIMLPTPVQHAPIVKPEKVPKPANSFILYRKWRQEALKVDHPNLPAKKICEFWRSALHIQILMKNSDHRWRYVEA